MAGTMEAEGGEAAKEEPVRADGMPLTLALALALPKYICRCQNRWRCAGAALALPKYICRCQNRWRSAGSAALALRWRWRWRYSGATLRLPILGLSVCQPG